MNNVQNFYRMQCVAINDDVIRVTHKLMCASHATSAIVGRKNAQVIGIFNELRGKLGRSHWVRFGDKRHDAI